MTTLFFLIFAFNAVITGGHLIDGIFTEPTLKQGYNLVAHIPAGATNLNVTELRHTNNYLAVRLEDGTFLINGNYSINWSGAYKAAGSTFIYHRQTHQQLESIGAIGPLSEPVDVMVLYQEPNPGIVYRYVVPGKESPDIEHLGRSSSSHSHKVFEIGSSKKKNDPNSLLGDDVLPPIKRFRKRKFAWRPAGFTACTKTCGGGFQTRSHICIREHTQTQVPSKRCHNLEKPADILHRCNVGPCPPRWRSGGWSECSVTCGKGIRNREVECVQEVSSQLIVPISNGACTDETLPTDEPCELPACKNGTEIATTELSNSNSHWNISNWTPCSTTCGPGERRRTVTCVGDDEDDDEDDEDCPLEDKPRERESCDLGLCHQDNSVALQKAQWLHTEWSHECPTGIQSRRIFCDKLSEENCDDENRPDSTRLCSSEKTCCGQWFIGPWTECSAPCETGEQMRDVVCVTSIHGSLRVVLDMNCPVEKPETRKVCSGPPCSPTWFISDWTECSKSCGKGFQTRIVKCLTTDSNRFANESQCSLEDKPISRRLCNEHHCKHFDSRDSDNQQHIKQMQNNPDGLPADESCKDTTSNCPLVIQARLCIYSFYRKICCQSCSKVKHDSELTK